MTCPKCGSENVKSEQKQAVHITVKKPHNGCLWWLLLGWLYIIYIVIVYLIKAVYWVCFGWWIGIIKKHKAKVESQKIVHICQNCGYHWED